MSASAKMRTVLPFQSLLSPGQTTLRGNKQYILYKDIVTTVFCHSEMLSFLSTDLSHLICWKDMGVVF